MFSPVIVFAMIFLVRYLATRNGAPSVRGQSKGAPFDTRFLLWCLWVAAWVYGIYATFRAPTAVQAAVRVLLLGAAGVVLFRPWPLLRWLSRRGLVKLVFWLAEGSLVFARKHRETRPAACLLAALALAHRGRARADEIAWVEAKLGKTVLRYGTFGCALGVLELLRARVARDEARAADSRLHANRARMFLGTLTYFSPRALPRPVALVVYELLALDDVSVATWGALELAPAHASSRVVLAIRAVMHETLSTDRAPTAEERRARRRLASAPLEAVAARPKPEAISVEGQRALWQWVQPTYLRVLRGEPTSFVARLQLVTALDYAMAPGELVPETISADEEQHTLLLDTLVEGLAPALARDGVPFAALNEYGPVSARLHARVEQELFGSLERTLQRIEERVKNGLRQGDVRDEWLDTAELRRSFRNVQLTLGEAASRRVWPIYATVATNYGVLLSERFPRNRPLAHAVFASLETDARHYEDAEISRLSQKNAGITDGLQ